MRSRTLFHLVAMFALLLGVFAGSGTADAGTPSPDGNTGQDVDRSVPGEVLVQYKASAGKAAKAEARAKVGATKMRTIRTLPSSGRDELELAALPKGRSVADAVRGLEAHPAVAFAEPNWIYTQQAESDDPYYTGGSLYGMYGDATSPANQYGSQAGEAWAAGHTGSTSVYVGVIDEGADYNHEDLVANKWTNPGESGTDATGRDKATNGVDDDGNGYLDDVHGWDFLGNNKSCYDGNATNQGEKHGTHVSGTIGAQGGNGIGVAGVNWNVTIICGKFLGGNGGTTADAIEAVDYFTDLRKNRGINVVATNNSWGGGGYSQSLYDAIERANTAGVLYIAAAGNGGNDGIGDNNDRTPHYPSSYTNANVVAVASTNNAGGRSTFSNYGLNSVDIGAPGTSIYSTLPSYLSTPYGSYSGTSMASPHVAGAAALYASVHPGASAAQIKAALLDTAIPTASIARDSNTPVATGGRLDANAALGGRTAPPMVLGVTVTTNKPAYSFGETATITVRVSDGVDAVSGATVSLSVRTPKGKTSTYSGTTNADGTASFPYTPMLKRDGAGTYTASGTASKTSYDGGTASTTFTFKR